MDMSQINIVAIVVAALSSFMLGGLWYSPALFGNIWMQANGFTEEQLKTFNMKRAFGWSIVFALVIASNLGLFLGHESTTWTWGMIAGGLAGFGWAAMSIGTVAMFEHRSWSYVLVNGGYCTCAYILMGLIIGLWR